MKRSLKNFIALIIVAVIILAALSACVGPEPVYFISTPKDVRFEDGEMKWDKVDKADEYLVKINGEIFSTSGTFYADFQPEVEYKVSVASKNVWATSEWTEEQTVIFLAPPTKLVYMELDAGGKFLWTEPEHASAYVIAVDGEEQTVPLGNNYRYEIYNAGTFTAKIQSLGDNVKYFDSKFSDEYTKTIDVIEWDTIESVEPEGDGDAQTPFLMNSVGAFKWLTEKVAEDYEFSQDKYFEMTEDVDFRYISGYVPIGTSEEPFLGHFDGNDYWVRNLAISATNAGIFGCNGNGSTISNIIFVGGNVNGISTAGAISASNLGQITNCVNYGAIHGNTAGGIVGQNTDGKMIYDCVNYGDVSGENVGGILGFNWNGTVYLSVNYGEIKGTANAGGIVGENVGNIFYCENSGGVTSINAGGICYSNMGVGIIKASYNSGYISGTRKSGGITATNNGGNIKYSYNVGTVVSDSDYDKKYVGGLVGEMSNGVVLLSYNLGDVHHMKSPTRDLGALVGYYRTGLISRCYYLANEDGIKEIGNTDRYITDDGGVIAMTESEFKRESTVDTFNSFVNPADLSMLETKIFIKGESYPMLYWEIED